MKRWAMCVGMLFAIGCGGGDGRPNTGQQQPDLLIGNWLLEQSATAGVGLTFTDAGTYVFSQVRVDLSAGVDDAQVENGRYSEFPTSITFDPTQSSCPGAHPSWQAGYSVTDQSLSISDASGALLFVPNTSPGGSVAITYGCFASDGTFTASPLTSI